MNKVKVGNIVKFLDRDGNLNGGTVRAFKRQNNEEMVIINSLDGKEVKMKKNDLTLIHRQQRGRISAQYLSELKEEIEKENKEGGVLAANESKVENGEPEPVQTTELPQDELIEELKRKLLVRDQAINDYRDMVNSLQEENSNLKKNKPVTQPPCNQEDLIFTIKGLSDALVAASINKEGDSIMELLKIINRLNRIE